MNCKICGHKVEETFLNKPIGTYVKNKGKYLLVCSSCQKRHKDIREKLFS